MWRCSRCGTDNFNNAEKCSRCGATRQGVIEDPSFLERLRKMTNSIFSNKQSAIAIALAIVLCVAIVLVIRLRREDEETTIAHNPSNSLTISETATPAPALSTAIVFTEISTPAPTKTPAPTPTATATHEATASPQPQTAQVPYIIGDYESSALQALRDSGLTVITVERVYSDTVGADRVISISVGEGTTVPIATNISVYVSKGAEPVVMPDVVGLSYSSASSLLKNEGFSVVASYTYSRSTPEDYVVSQSIAKNSLCKKGDLVELTVSLGADRNSLMTTGKSVSTTGVSLEYPNASDFFDQPFTATIKASSSGGSIYIMPKPQTGNGNLGTIRNGTPVTIWAERNKCYFFETADGVMGWNGTSFFSTGSAGYITSNNNTSSVSESTNLSGTPNIEDVRAFGTDITYPKRTSFLSQYETMYVKSEKGNAIYVYWKPQAKEEYRRPFNLPEGHEVTVLARENGLSCCVFTLDNGKQYVGWVNSAKLVY